MFQTLFGERKKGRFGGGIGGPNSAKLGPFPALCGYLAKPGGIELIVLKPRPEVRPGAPIWRPGGPEVRPGRPQAQISLEHRNSAR